MTQTVQQSCLIVLSFLLLPRFTPQHLLLVGILKSNATPYITVLEHACNSIHVCRRIQGFAALCLQARLLVSQ